MSTRGTEIFRRRRTKLQLSQEEDGKNQTRQEALIAADSTHNASRLQHLWVRSAFQPGGSSPRPSLFTPILSCLTCTQARHGCGESAAAGQTCTLRIVKHHAQYLRQHRERCRGARNRAGAARPSPHGKVTTCVLLVVVGSGKSQPAGIRQAS